MVVWNLNDLYDPKDREQLIAELKEKVKEFTGCREKLTPELAPEEFMNLIKKLETIKEISSRLIAYADLKQCENTSDSECNAMLTKTNQLITELGNQLIFFSHWFKEITDADAQKYIDASGKYRYYLERLRQAKQYTLKEKEEQIINLKDVTGAEALTNIYDIITNRYRYEVDGKPLSYSEAAVFLSGPSREKRVEVYDKVMQKFKDEQDILIELYKNIVNDWQTEGVQLRGYTSSMAVRNYRNDIPDAAIKTMLSVVRKNVTVFQEYFKLKQKVCDLKNDRYDLYAPYSKVEKKYSYDDTIRIVLDTYKECDQTMYERAKKVVDAQHIHSDLTANKRGGAFNYGPFCGITPYVLLNHTDNLRDVFTAVHELGHSIHSISASVQTGFTSSAPIPMAETASIFGEMLLMHKLLRDGAAEEKKSVLFFMLDEQYASIVLQAYVTLFEIDAHELIKEGASGPQLNDLHLKYTREQFGDAVEVPELFKYGWTLRPHIFHTPFYCYAYSFGCLLVLALYKMYEKEGKSFIPKYLEILEAGGSAAPADILAKVGIDITKESFWEQGFDIIREEVEELKKLVG